MLGKESSAVISRVLRSEFETGSKASPVGCRAISSQRVRGVSRSPKRPAPESILFIGAGPIVIGQACEFDYSGAQACKALREEGYRVILVNSNPATIMTDPEMADSIYIEPINWRTVARIIENTPDARIACLNVLKINRIALDTSLDEEGRNKHVMRLVELRTW